MRYGRQQKPRLRIAVHGMNERNVVMLKMLFQGPDWQDCEIVGNGAADFGLVDLDTPAPDRDWAAFRSRHPELPAVVLSLRDQVRDNASHLRKPFDAGALRAAIDALRDGADRKARGTRRVTEHAPRAAQAVAEPPHVAPPPSPAPQAGATTRNVAGVFDPETDERHCGQRPDDDLASPRAGARIVYDPPAHFQGVLEHALRQARENNVAVTIRGLPATFTIIPGPVPAIATPLKDSVLRSLCVLTMKPGSLRVELAPAVDQDAALVRADVVLWQVALWTARGRLRRGIGLDAPQRLVRWPDFTRQVETPHAMRLTAVLTAGARTPRELATTLGIPQRYVFSLLSAAASVGLLERRSAPAAPPAPKAAPPARGLLSRILGRLVPGA